MQIARDMINERGGVNGRKVEFLLGDATSPNAAISETERLITKDGIKITTGSVRLAARDCRQPGRRAPWRLPLGDHGRGRDHHPPRLQAYVPGRRAARASTARRRSTSRSTISPSGSNKPVGDLRIALLWENRAFGKSVGDGIRAYAKTKNIKLVYDEGYDQFATDMTPIVQKLKDVKPDVLIAISFPNDAILFQRKAKELDFNVGRLHRCQRRLFRRRICATPSATWSTAFSFPTSRRR